MHVKLSLVALLVGYHFLCARVMRGLQCGESTWTPKQLRALNEVPTLLLVTVVMLVVFKSAFPTSAGVWLNVGLVLSFIISIQLYAKKRRRDAERLKRDQSAQSS